jgi:hypothetical protein
MFPYDLSRRGLRCSVVVDTRLVVRRDVVCLGIAFLDFVILGVWVWADNSSPQTVFLYGTPSFYVLCLVFVILGCLGFGVLARLGREQWRRPSAMCLWVSSILLLVPLALYLLLGTVTVGF